MSKWRDQKRLFYWSERIYLFFGVFFWRIGLLWWNQSHCSVWLLVLEGSFQCVLLGTSFWSSFLPYEWTCMFIVCVFFPEEKTWSNLDGWLLGNRGKDLCSLSHHVLASPPSSSLPISEQGGASPSIRFCTSNPTGRHWIVCTEPHGWTTIMGRWSLGRTGKWS